MMFKQIDLTTALRPSLLAAEELLFVQDGVGLYQGYALWFLAEESYDHANQAVQ